MTGASCKTRGEDGPRPSASANAPHRILRSLLAALLAASLAWAWCGASRFLTAAEIKLFDDPVLVKGKNLEIRRSDLDAAVLSLKATLASQNQAVPANKDTELQTNTLERLVVSKLVIQRATPEDRKKAKEAADKLLAEEKAKLPSEAAFKRRLISLGLTLPEFESKALDDKIIDAVIDREIRSKLTVTPDEIKEFYDKGVDAEARELQKLVVRLSVQPETSFYKEAKRKLEEVTTANLARLVRQEQVRAQHILIYTIDKVTREPLPEDAKKAKREIMLKLQARVRAGEDFSKLVMEASEDPEISKTHGEYVVTPESNMASEMRAALFSLGVNQVSDIVTTAYGLHLVKILERTPRGKPPLDQIQAEIKDALLKSEVFRQLPAYTERIKKEAQIEVVTPL